MNTDGVDRLAFVSATARVWRRTAKEAEAAREAFDDAIVRAVADGNTQRAVARAADISEPLVRKIIASRKADQ